MLSGKGALQVKKRNELVEMISNETELLDACAAWAKGKTEVERMVKASKIATDPPDQDHLRRDARPGVTGASNRRATTMRRKQFKVILRHRETGEEIEKIIFAEDEDEARERATELTRHRLVGMPDRAQFDVVSCTL